MMILIILLFLILIGFVTFFLYFYDQQQRIIKGTDLPLEIKNELIPLEGNELINYFSGTWYEKYRFNSSFEAPDLINVTATYKFNKEKKEVEIINRGYSTEKKEWKQANGLGKPTINKGAFAVTFYEPFYGGYYIIGYRNEKAIVTSSDYKNLWLLQRSFSDNNEKDINNKEWFLQQAKKVGYTDNQLKSIVDVKQQWPLIY